ncbi:DNA helicase UvrD [Candidatus Woesearchaeota archaeon]|nr:DNA helicase UvrD [Candidatus Woesearchaeota archaeon]
MAIIADLHIHSKYSRACSAKLDLQNLEKFARIKGISLLGTGDFTHPKWIKELKTKLVEDGSGILRTKRGFPFLLSTELSFIYSQGGKGRRIHNIVLAKNFEMVDQITDILGKNGRLDYDGRPIFGISCIEFVELMKEIDESIEIIPAHIWTPWFSLFGSNSGFDAVQECFGDQTKHIHALETGLSSNPAMNWRLSQLDKFQIVSFSDSHSFWPWRLGREATVFDTKLQYDTIVHALRTGEGLAETMEVSPLFGKYHLTGHRNCNVCMEPKEALQHKNICPKCKKPLTVGVEQRVEALADRELGYRPKHAKPFKTLIPLTELLAQLFNAGIATKRVLAEYFKIVEAFGNELRVLLEASSQELRKVTQEPIVDVILQNREGKVPIKGGYDGVYGVPLVIPIEDKTAIERKTSKAERGQPTLLDF